MPLVELLGLLSAAFVAAFSWHAATRAPGAGQSPRSAIVEAWANIVVGFTFNYLANWVIIPLAIQGAHMTAWGNFWMGWIFTALSIVRQYVIRRWFNARLHALAQRITPEPGAAR